MESLRLYVRCSLLKEPFLFVVRNPTAVTLKTLIKQLEHVISEQYGDQVTGFRLLDFQRGASVFDLGYSVSEAFRDGDEVAMAPGNSKVIRSQGSGTAKRARTPERTASSIASTKNDLDLEEPPAKQPRRSAAAVVSLDSSDHADEVRNVRDLDDDEDSENDHDKEKHHNEKKPTSDGDDSDGEREQEEDEDDLFEELTQRPPSTALQAEIARLQSQSQQT